MDGLDAIKQGLIRDTEDLTIEDTVDEEVVDQNKCPSPLGGSRG